MQIEINRELTWNVSSLEQQRVNCEVDGFAFQAALLLAFWKREENRSAIENHKQKMSKDLLKQLRPWKRARIVDGSTTLLR